AMVAKSWSTLWRPKLNIAWLPSDQVFLRVIQLPKSDRAELLSMVELQLEKLSPLPVGQIAWSLELIPHRGQTPTEMQTVAVIIMARNLVEEFLGGLEKQGYLADRLEVPILHEMITTPVEADGAWIYPRTVSGKTLCLVAWWYGGILRNLSLIHVTATDRLGSELGDILTKAAWAGELEGWLTSPPRWH